MKKTFFYRLVLIIPLMTGCTLAPSYQRPEAPIPGDWPSGVAYRETGGPAVSELRWREFFLDGRLIKIIETALCNNRDLRLAALNVQRARALYGIQRAEIWPAAQAAGFGSLQRIPADLSATGKAMTAEQYSVQLGVFAWEIDFFGRIRSLKDQALEEYLGTEQAARSARILLVSATANAYLALAADRESRKLAESTFETQKEVYDLIRRRCEVGLASELELRQAQTQVDAARGEVARYTQRAAQDENALILLVGSPAPAELLPEDLGGVSAPREISAGLSSEVLLRRPDILSAEHRLKAAYAIIGAARAAFFPRITLTTSVGTASSELSGLFKSGSATWSFIPQIVMPVFDARTWAAYEGSKAEQEIALAQYEKTIQTAFREVADALAVRGTVEEQIAAQESLVKAAGETHRLARLRYEKGIDSYLGVLDAQRSLRLAEQVLIAFRLERIANQVRLYAVLGGGSE